MQIKRPAIGGKTREDRRRRARNIANDRVTAKVRDMRLTHGLYEESLLPGYLQGYNDALTDIATAFPTTPPPPRVNTTRVRP